jgi:guanylate kinase
MTLSNRIGVALVICAPSGTGKTTLVRRLVEEFPGFAYSISCTTRSPRANEQNGVDYEFISREEFLHRSERGFFAEWAEVHGNFYGTPLEATRTTLAAGRDLLFDIDVQGAAQLKKNLPGAYFVFVLPPSRQELERRLSGRGTESPESLAKRLRAACGEMAEAGWFDAWVINDDLDAAFADLKVAYIAATLSPRCRPKLVPLLIEQWSSEQ